MRALLPWMLLCAALIARAQTPAPNPPAAGAVPLGQAAGPAPSPPAPASAATPPPPRRDIVQQRLPDGRVIFTDRPLSEARTLRTWQFEPEDPQLAAARRAAAERESAAVSERIARRLEQEREIDREMDLARLEAARAAAERDAVRAREAEPRQVIVWPPHGWRPGPPFRPRPPGVHPPRRPDGPVARPPYPRPPPGALPPPHWPGSTLPPHPGANRPPRGPGQPIGEWPH
jgi:hypothetical protein